MLVGSPLLPPRVCSRAFAELARRSSSFSCAMTRAVDIARQIASAVSFLFIDLSFFVLSFLVTPRFQVTKRRIRVPFARVTRLWAMQASRKRSRPHGQIIFPAAALLARIGLLLLDLLQDLIQVVAGRTLHRRKLLVGFKFLQPQGLADGQQVPV